MGLVHDVIAGFELQRVDDVAAAVRKLLDLARVVACCTSVELGLAQHRQLRLAQLEAGLDGCLHEVRDAEFGIRWEGVDDATGEIVLGKHGCRPLDETGTLRGDDDGPFIIQESADVGDGAIRIAGEAQSGSGIDAHVVVVGGFDSGGFDTLAARATQPATFRWLSSRRRRRIETTTVETAQRPPRPRPRRRAQLRHREEVTGVQVDGRLGSGRRRIPRRRQELPVRLPQAHGPRRDPLG